MTAPISNAPGSSGQDALAAAKQLEAYFLRQILSEVGPSSAMGGEGVAGSTFRGMFEEALADAVSETGQVGLAETIVGSLEGVGGIRASADLAETAVWGEAGASDDPEVLADVAMASKMRSAGGDGATAADVSSVSTLNLGRKGTNPTKGGE